VGGSEIFIKANIHVFVIHSLPPLLTETPDPHPVDIDIVNNGEIA
jgi:hypothetical protein